MDPEKFRTSDGSDTLFRRDLNQHYHSTHGALQESRHIFIDAGFIYAIDRLHPHLPQQMEILHILEIGFGTGLNALLTLIEAEKRGIKVHYTTIEAFPLDKNCWQSLNYPLLFSPDDFTNTFNNLHLAGWDKPSMISPDFTLHKIQCELESYLPSISMFNLIYFDAFGPDAQPELWTDGIFQNLGNGLTRGGILVTYSVKGIVVRALRAAGLQTEKLAGPPGKRHILRAVKP
jgi:tRNA U34 5-methylaminomethyl-2-thiouridine-forming methyltransferase MnmC